MNKLHIITNSTFPFGNANSNYLRYFALSLKNIGWDVSVIGSNLSGKCEEKGEYEEIKFRNIILKEKRLPFHLTDHLSYGKELKTALETEKIEKDDYVFVYSMYMDLVKTVLKQTSNLNKGHLSIGMVEWFLPYQYRFGKINPDYIFWKQTFEKLVTKYPKIFPISRKLEEFYLEAGCETMVLPIMADTMEHKNDKLSQKHDKYNFIYSGAATNKDSIEGMMKALTVLSAKEREKISFHFTSMSKDKLIAAAHLTKEEYSEIESCLVFHGWLEFSELIELYKNMDFLFLAREENTVTLSNFPSKVPELMCYGVVPVCSNVGDYTELYLKDSIDSIQFEGAQTEECAKGFKRAIALSQDELLDMKNNARKCAEERFDYHIWSNKIAEFLLK